MGSIWNLFFCSLTILSSSLLVQAFPTGAPKYQCIAPSPYHIRDVGQYDEDPYLPSTSDSPYNISIQHVFDNGTIDTDSLTSTGVYEPNYIFHITVSSKSPATDPILGFVLYVRRDRFDTKEALGTFLNCTSYPNPNSVKLISSFSVDGSTNCATHNINVSRTNVSCYWKAPSNYEGRIAVGTTVVKDYSHFWTNTAPALLNQVDYTVRANLSSTALATTYLSTSGCGTRVTCILYPPNCELTGCKYILSINPNPQSNYVEFQFVGPYTENSYLAMAISNNNTMGQDEIFGCSVDPITTRVEMKYYFSPGHIALSMRRNDNIQNVTGRNFTDKATGDNKIECSFRRPYSYSINSFTFNGSSGDYTNNLSSGSFYYFLATGNLFNGTTALIKHKTQPLISSEPIDLSQPVKKIYFRSLLYRQKVHGTLEVIAWMCLAVVGTFISRHLRPDLQQKDKQGKPAWFLAHVPIMVISFAFAVAGFIYIVSINTYWKMQASAHGGCGLTAVGLSMVNIIMGAARPHPGHKRRKIFNWLHFVVALLARVMSIITIWLALFIDFVPLDFQTFGCIVIAIWTTIEVFIFLILLAVKKIMFKRLSHEEDSNSGERTQLKPMRKIDSYPYVHPAFTGFYFIVIAGVFIAFLAGIWLY